MCDTLEPRFEIRISVSVDLATSELHGACMEVTWSVC